jgi:cytochrome c553
LAAPLAALMLVFHGCTSSQRPVQRPRALHATAVAGNPELAQDPAAQSELARRLDQLFGPPDAPRLAQLASFADAGFDPNRWTLDEGGVELRARIATDNRVRFAHELRAIAEERFDDLDPGAWPLDLRAAWHDQLQRERGRKWRAAAQQLFSDYYPSAATSAAAFRANCSRCHGAVGGGDGPMAARLRTRPRDYRTGRFKRTPLADRARPRHADLVATIQQGIPGTAMPAFGPRLALADIAGLADHVRMLSIRGETELLAVFDFDADAGFDAEELRATYALVVERWRESGEHLIVPSLGMPEATPERIAHGRELFHDAQAAGCVRCHGESGHGDGPAAEPTDPFTGERRPLLDDWGHPIRPRDLVCSPFRFGDRPIDLFRRMHSGIQGTPMPAHHGALVTEPGGARHLLSDEDLWDLVLYVISLRAAAPGPPS